VNGNHGNERAGAVSAAATVSQPGAGADLEAPARRRTTHWSRPAALRCLRALVRLGGSATSWPLAQEARALNISTDIHAARCWLAAAGYERNADGEPLVTTDEGIRGRGWSRDGRRVFLYTLRADVLRKLIGTGVAIGHDT